MDRNAVDKLAPDLANAVLALETLLSDGASQTDFDVMALRKRTKVLAADLLEAWKSPQPFAPWSPANPRNAG